MNNGEENVESLDKVGSIDLNNDNDADMSGSLEDLRKLSESYDQEMAENYVDANNGENGNGDAAEHDEEVGGEKKEKGNDEGKVKNDQDKNICPCWCQVAYKIF